MSKTRLIYYVGQNDVTEMLGANGWWEITKAGPSGADAPVHRGAIKYLKEIGVWTEKDQLWNDKRIAHMKKVQQAWEEAVEEAHEKKIKGKNFPEFWLKKRQKALMGK